LQNRKPFRGLGETLTGKQLETPSENQARNLKSSSDAASEERKMLRRVSTNWQVHKDGKASPN
jgi:hypothetical protein